MPVADEPIWLHVDSARIAQVITNLLNNSAAYTPPGGQITLGVERDDDHVVIRVRDNGIGIPPEALPTLFEMFRQVAPSDRPQGGGLGIGLALARRLVEMHGGRIEAHSEGIGQGSEFVVRLPMVTATSIGDAVTTPQGGTPATGRRLKVLVVDDNADLVEMLAVAVECAGHDVRTALDGRTAISAALSYRPDVMLLDLGMPLMGGLEVARELRQHPEMANLRLVAVTGWGQVEDRRRTQEAGFDHHLTKPTDPQKMQDLLTQIANERAG